ncbi:MAG: hypothetical protein JSW07_15105 [bacterium]|nr:MAG: hypothetical protein JSW07_15105 [bacterium]
MEKFIRNFLFLVLLNVILWSSSIAQDFYPDNLSTKTSRQISKNDTIKVSAKSPTGAMIRSLIIPGWGQLYNKKIFKAILVFGVEAGLIANSIYLNQKYKKSKTDLEREFYINNRNLSNWWLVGVILFSMADAFVDAHLSDFDESPDLSFFNIAPICNGKNAGLQLSICWYF